MVKRLMWSGLLAGLGALTHDRRPTGSRRVIWERVFDEDPPD